MPRHVKPSETSRIVPTYLVRVGGWGALKTALDAAGGGNTPSAHLGNLESHHLLSIIDSFGEAVTVIDRDYRVVFANHIALKLARISASETERQIGCREFFGEESPCEASADCPVHNVVSLRQPYHSYHQRVNSAGQAITLALSAWPLLDEEGNVAMVALVERDIPDLEPEKLQPTDVLETGAQKSGEEHAFSLAARAVSDAGEWEGCETAQLIAVNDLSRVISSSLDLEEILHSLAQGLPGIVDFDRASVTLIDRQGTKWQTRALSGFDSDSPVTASGRILGGTAAAWVIENRAPRISKDLAQEAVFREDTALLAEGIRSRITVPLLAKNRALGALTLESRYPDRYGEESLEILDLVAKQTATAIENSYLFEDARTRTKELSALHSLALDISKTLDESEVIRAALERIDDIAESQLRTFLRLDAQTRELRAFPSLGGCAEVSRYLERCEKAGETPVFVEALEGTVFITDISAYPSLLPLATHYSFPTSLVVIPVCIKGSTESVLVLVSAPGEGYVTREVALFEGVCNQVGIGVERARLHQEVSHLAVTDGLTELLNHRYFYQRLGEELRRARTFGRSLCLLFIDVDNLRTVNDVHGHLKGDRVLHELGQLIKQKVRGTDIVARYGGDEFTVILPESSEHQAEMLSRRLQHAVAEAALLGPDSQGKVTISIGVARLTSEVMNEAQLVSRADQAAYRAKESGRNAVAVYGR